jgi:anti-sigma factor RsiW
MPLSADQTATLQLLLQRRQRYSDLAGVLGVEESEVRVRARAALIELGGADPDRNVGLTDYLLGQADPIGRADASRHLRQHPEDRELVSTLAERLREMFPGAELPRLPGEPRPAGRLRRPTASGQPGALRRRLGGGPDLSQPQTRLIAILGIAAVLLIAAVLGITGAFGGDDDDSGSTTAEATSTTAAPADESAVPIQLRPSQGSDAGGVIVVGFATADQPFIEFQIRNLEPATDDKAYVLWFLSDGNTGFPLPQQLPVQANGTLNQRIAVPPEILAFVQEADSVAIALNDRASLNRDITRAIENNQGALAFPGGTVLSARIARGGDSAG